MRLHYPEKEFFIRTAVMHLRLTPSSLRTIMAAVVVAAAVHLAQSRDMVVDFTRPVVLQSLHWLGIEAADGGDELHVGRLLVPWTRDCAGVNLLLILLALAVWVNRRESRALRFWLCLAGMVPAAVAANVLRVLTLLAYRTVAYPGVESPQTHYFMGFMWLVPFIALITPRDHRPGSARLMETLHAGAVVALLAPMAGTPNATLLMLAALTALAQCRVQAARESGASPLAMAAWVGAGLGVAVMGTESFWLPWLLVCPLLVHPRWVFSLPGLACLACTHSLVVMQPWAWGVAGVGLAWAWHKGGALTHTPRRNLRWWYKPALAAWVHAALPGGARLLSTPASPCPFWHPPFLLLACRAGSPRLAWRRAASHHSATKSTCPASLRRWGWSATALPAATATTHWPYA